jgi:ankyrin repeat protein
MAGVPALALAAAVAAACGPPPQRQLCEAIAKRDLFGVREALQSKSIELLKNKEGCTPVEAAYAATTPDDATLTEIGVELVRGGLPPEAAWEKGGQRVTAIEAAATNGNVELVRALLAVGLNVEDRDTIRAFHAAAGGGKLEVVRLMVGAGVDPAVEFNGRAPAMAAHEQNRDEVEKFLLDEIAARADAAEMAQRLAASDPMAVARKAAAAKAAAEKAMAGDSPDAPQ